MAEVLANRSSSQVEQNDKILYNTKKRLGKKSSNGTFVYEGTFGGRPVAVKVLLGVEKSREAKNEISTLINYDGHKNIIRYFGFEIREEFGYILALELCHPSTLEDWVKLKDEFPVKIDGLEILRQVTEGLAFLHRDQNGRQSIIHRDLKPSNILFHGMGIEVLVKISDFGISRVLEVGRTSKSFTSIGGTEGWKAPEILEAEEKFQNGGSDIPKMTKKIDIFSLGCIFYYVLTMGIHPFGKNRNENIKAGAFVMDETLTCLRLRCNKTLIESMIAHTSSMRPDVEFIRSHSIFWSNRKMLEFFVQISNFISKKFKHKFPHYKFRCNFTKIPTCVRNLEKSYFGTISNTSQGWFYRLDSRLRDVFERSDLYHDKNGSVKQLIRMIRNLSQHFYEDDFSPELRNYLGDIPDDFMTNWLTYFPDLLNEVRNAFFDFSGETCLQTYYNIDKE